MKYFVAIVLVILGMVGVFVSVRALARFVIGFVLLGAIVLSCYIINEEDLAWRWAILLSVLAGAVGGILCIPVLPYAGLEFLTREDD